MLGGSKKRPRQEAFINWNSPPLDWIKLNSDGASRGNPGVAGGGRIFRSATGAFVQAYSMKCGTCSSVKAERWAALKGLVIAREMQIPRLILEVDSEVVVRTLLDDPAPCNPNYYLILQCRTLLTYNDLEVRVKHVYREANEVANWLANERFDLPCSFYVFTAPPVGRHDILYVDLVGYAQPRTIIN